MAESLNKTPSTKLQIHGEVAFIATLNQCQCPLTNQMYWLLSLLCIIWLIPNTFRQGIHGYITAAPVAKAGIQNGTSKLELC